MSIGEERDLPVSGLFSLSVTNPPPALSAARSRPTRRLYYSLIPGTTMTSVKGVFAAGMCRIRDIAKRSQAQEWCMAALEVEKLLSEEDELRGD